MKLFFILAWRNLWRNKQRTLITTASVFFAVVLVLFTRSMQLGTYEHMIESTVQMSTGYLQIQAEEFWEKRSLDQSIEYSSRLIDSVTEHEHVTLITPRIESFALVSSGETTSGAAVFGIDPSKENRMNSLSERVERGSYFSEDREGVLIPSGLAENLDVSVEDTLVLLSQGYHGVSAAGAYPVIGILDIPNPDLSTGVVYMSLSQAQWFYGLGDRITAFAIMIDNPSSMPEVASTLRKIVPESYRIMTWREMMPELVQAIQVDNAGGIIMLGILYVVIAFGMFGTVMMMAVERKREFSVLSAVGTRKVTLSMTVLLETIAIALLGTFTGIALAFPILLYMNRNPIELTGSAAEAMVQYGYEPLIPFTLDPALFVNQPVVVFCIALFASAYPIFWITRIRISNALRV